MQKKWKIVLGVLLVIIIVGYLVFENSKGLEANVLEVAPLTIAKTFKEEGTVVPAVEQPVYATYGGEIINMAVEEGQEVKKGQLLAVINSKELDFQIKQLQAQLLSLQGEVKTVYQEPVPSSAMIRSQELQVEQARYNLETAETNFMRIEQLFNAGALAKKELDEVENIVALARINLELQQEALSLLFESHSPAGGTEELYAGRAEAIKAQIELLQYQINKQTIHSPIAGTVANLSVKQGEPANPHLPMMNIFQKGSYVVEVFILSADVASIEQGMQVQLIQDRRGADFIIEGIVKKIAPTAVEAISALGLAEQRVNVTVEPVVSETIFLFPGYKLDVEFTLEKRENELVVPKTVLFPYENGEALWVVKDGKAVVQPVTTGFEIHRNIVITGGLSAGDLVILNPQLEGLKEGKKIEIKMT